MDALFKNSATSPISAWVGIYLTGELLFVDHGSSTSLQDCQEEYLAQPQQSLRSKSLLFNDAWRQV